LKQVVLMKVLMVEDERDLADAVATILQKNNYAVDNAYDGEFGLDCALTGIYDFIILDIMLPKMDGLRVIKELRAAGVQTPVLMLTARGEIRDRVAGLDLGADDYLPKPFHIDELLARLRALGRRKSEFLIDGVIQLGSISFNPQMLTLTYNGNETSLTLKESQLLELLSAHKGGYVSKDLIIEKVWSYDADVQDSHVESQVSLLRKKLAAAGGELTVKASRGVGYRLESV
jgi:DNA-binding response OmpR family regulator